MVAFRAWGKQWYEELKKLQYTPQTESQEVWRKADQAHKDWYKKMGEGITRGVWLGKDMSLLERQQLFSEMVRGNPWYEARMLGMYGENKMQEVGRSVYRKHKAVKDPLGRVVKQRTGMDVARWYTSGSKVVASTNRSAGLKLRSGEKGWFIDGKLRTERQVQMTLRSLDHTIFAEELDWSLEQTFLEASASQKVEIMEALEDVDWHAFWNDYYPDENGYDVNSTAADTFYDVTDRIQRTVRRR